MSSRTMQYVNGQLPMLQLEEEDLEKNPHFSKLLLELCQILEPSGGSSTLSRELEEEAHKDPRVHKDLATVPVHVQNRETVAASDYLHSIVYASITCGSGKMLVRGRISPEPQVQRELRLQRKVWLRSEVIHRLIQEMLLDLQVRKQEGKTTDEENKFLDGLQQCLLVTQCSGLLPSSNDAGSVSLLGLEKQDLLDLLPSSTDILWIRERLHKQLEEALRKKCFTFLSFHQPETDKEKEVHRAAKALRLASTLEDEKRRLQTEEEKHQEMGALLERQQEMYPHVLLRCLSLLRRAASDLRLQAQSDIDCMNAEYLEAKSNALFLKLRMEELQVLTDTYTPDKVDVHKYIRSSLETAVKTEKSDLAASKQILASYEFLGTKFEELVQEYTRLRDKIKDNRWAIQELSKTLP